MALAILIVSCVVLYSTSKYSPIRRVLLIEKDKKLTITVACVILLLSFFFFSTYYDFTTALVVWLISFMTILSAVVLSIKMNVKWIWIWGGFCILMILVDLI